MKSVLDFYICGIGCLVAACLFVGTGEARWLIAALIYPHIGLWLVDSK